MTLEEKLKRLKQIEQEKTEPDWILYKDGWVSSIKELQNTIMYKWFGDYEKNKLMEFSVIPVKRIEPHIGEYLTTSLEITLANNKTMLLEPIAGITTEYSGKLEFSMLGNVYKNISILRHLLDGDKYEWIIATSSDIKEKPKLTKAELEKFIDTWLS